MHNMSIQLNISLFYYRCGRVFLFFTKNYCTHEVFFRNKDKNLGRVVTDSYCNKSPTLCSIYRNKTEFILRITSLYTGNRSSFQWLPTDSQFFRLQRMSEVPPSHTCIESLCLNFNASNLISKLSRCIDVDFTGLWCHLANRSSSYCLIS